MYCPKCRTEYREGFATCADCGEPLVTESSVVEARRKRQFPIAVVLPKATQPILFVLVGMLLGIALGFPGRRIYYHLRYPDTRGTANVMKWAYVHVPAVVGSSPGAARMLDTVLTGTGTKGEARMVYEDTGSIKVIETSYVTSNGAVTSPTDDQLRRLNQSARSLVLHPERQAAAASPN